MQNIFLKTYLKIKKSTVIMYCKELHSAYSDCPEKGLLGHSDGIFTTILVKHNLLIL